jgi:uncharacterized protein YcbX
MLQISQLFIYPIKSLGGIEVKNALLTDRGFENDRRWMLIDENHRFITQREFAKAALLTVKLEDNGLRVTYKPSGEFIVIPYQPLSNDVCEVFIFDDTCMATYVGGEADEWFTGILRLKCRLVYMHQGSKRPVSEKYAANGEITSFSDAYPFLIIGQSSLDDLNNRLDKALPINRFRPNIVFTGGKPFEEDLMNNFTIGNINFYGVKLCARCIIPTIDQTNATKAKEPLKTLATYRRKNNDVYFGQNLIHKGSGIISVGDMIDVISYHDEERFII